MVQRQVPRFPLCIRPVPHRTWHKKRNCPLPKHTYVLESPKTTKTLFKNLKFNLNFSIQTWVEPGLPTINRTSAIKSLLNMAAFLSRTVGLVACQFGSKVLPDVPIGEIQGLDGGEPGALAGCITWRLSRCEITCGGDKLREPLFRVSAAMKKKFAGFVMGVVLLLV